MSTEQATELDFDATYRVAGWDGIAFHLIGYNTEEQYEGDLLICDDEECDHQTSEMCWAEGDTSIIFDTDNVIAVMVGDDRKHIVPVEDLTLLDEEVCSCGQIGCGWA